MKLEIASSLPLLAKTRAREIEDNRASWYLPDVMATTPADAEKELKEITDALIREYQPEKIILFGSRASGSPRPDSDFDLCLLKESAENPLDLIGKAYGVLWNVQHTAGVDFVTYTPARFAERQRMNDPFVRRIVSQGKVLYDARRSG